MRRARNFAAKLGMIFDEISAARSIAIAMEDGRQPSARALRTLGLAPDAFGGVRRG